MARIDNSFTMGVSPERAQEMFERDLMPDLHRDGGFQIAAAGPGRLELSDGVVDPTQVFSYDEAADPDIVGHEQQDDEPDVTAAEPRPAESALLRGSGAGEDRRPMELYAAVRGLVSRRIHVAFEADVAGTRVTIHGSARSEVRRGLERLGTPGHWPATAADPHD